MKVAKRFRWEGAHRLPWHNGGCQNLHGHSYYMWVELKGTPDERGMLIDFKDIKEIIEPLIKKWDHAVLVSETDTDLIKAVEMLHSKYYIFPYDTTSENICQFVAKYLAEHALELLLKHEINAVSIKLQETDTCYGEYEASIDVLRSMKGVTVASVEAFS